MHAHSDHAHHEHADPASTRLGIVFWLNLSFALIEIAGGLLLNSMAILADALHDFGDCLALGLAWYFQKLSGKKRDRLFSYGYKRFSLLAAVINGLILVGGSLLILRETVPRLWSEPTALNTPGIVGLAILGLSVNGFAVWRLRGGHSANEKVILLHLLEDVLGWAAVLGGGGLMYLTHWYWLDPLLAILIAFWISSNALRSLFHNLGILLQMIPSSVDLDELRAALLELPDIFSVHDLHSWSLDGEYNVLTLHVVQAQTLSPSESLQLKQKIRALARTHGIEHLTLEFETQNEACELEDC
ncbi:cation transporter [bacterium (Candidatus Blackallbacteria) CG17_big_fil_post_rev_8_21_14_2_50_48_46]|uniref:Cation transporter n=1 Tax=bacterium (Candidatus Blackallbacteria) CG17_big_fil_post_rev_8_21_14_2_50_48_46 TaxID=2014261 RepID=A0A2M7FY58_9BACT|nr:MAG: cation transporter [bacterium (Candidatus Blackallbacteria) CG18_big_fil_WC_8_21_14_2_50_49_26]PIW14241.1 MAG: cation transporter [bacterium (Candidatus Blackallbacteria) CG17_big_fil_post_rev_8_21_14_2_50_48_46]PIW46954.1 MAG: cation transporter [bacterium (Candidatus Blackallbacteria) CG13_big_fil_rev_8_21_14_2_50_49_14]